MTPSHSQWAPAVCTDLKGQGLGLTQLNSTQRKSMDAGVKHLSVHICIEQWLTSVKPALKITVIIRFFKANAFNRKTKLKEISEDFQLAAASCLSRRSVSIVCANEYLLLSTMICSSAISSRNCRSEYQSNIKCRQHCHHHQLQHSFVPTLSCSY